VAEICVKLAVGWAFRLVSQAPFGFRGKAAMNEALNVPDPETPLKAPTPPLRENVPASVAVSMHVVRLIFGGGLEVVT